MNGKRMFRGYLLLAVAAFALESCGGGGGAAGPAIGSATIQGSVPGTIVVAFDNATNLEAARAAATGTPKIFRMNLPTGNRYRFFLMENEGTALSRVYPMYMGGMNVFELDNSANGQTIDLGMVAPDLATGGSIPANTPALMMGRGSNAAVPPSLAGTAFSMDNVRGTTWGYNTLMTSGTRGWEFGTLAFDNNGSGRMTGIVRNGASLTDRNGIPFSISMSGMFLEPGDATFQGVASRDMSVMAATFTDNAGGPSMMIAQRRGGTFSTSDMNGTWRFQRLTAGSDNVASAWAYGTMTIFAGGGGGGGTVTAIATSSGSAAEIGRAFTFPMDGNGIVTEAADASFHGVMSADKATIVATDTNGVDPELWVLMKTGATVYSTADMAGDWVMHAVSSGNPGSRGWTYGHSVVDAGGNAVFTGMMGSTGPVASTQMTFTMNGGVMGMGGGMMGGGMMGGGMMGGGVAAPTFHGIMNGAKTLIVSTYSDGSGGYPFSVQVK